MEDEAVFAPRRDRLAMLGLGYVTAELGETGAPASVDVAIFALAGDLDDTPESEPLTALAGGGALVRVAQDSSVGGQATWGKDGLAQPLDHVFVTANGAARYVPKSCHVAADVTGSDHFPLRCDFD